MKKVASIAVSFFMLAVLLASCGGQASSVGSSQIESGASASSSMAQSQLTTPAQRTVFRIAGLKGPTTMGMVKLMNDAEGEGQRHEYQVEMFGTADEVNGKLINGDIDVAAIPANVASILYNKTNGAVRVVAINTLGVLYVVENGETVTSLEDLRGKTIYSTGKGSTPEIALNYILNSNGLVPGQDVMIEYKSEATELAALLAQGESTIAVLPQPYVTAVQMQNEKVRVALSLSEEWDKVSPESGMVTGVLVARTEFIEQNPQAFVEFLEDYQASIEFVNENVEQAAELVAKFGIVEKAPVAQKALPACNIVYIEGKEMQAKLSGYLQVLYNEKPESIGGAMPGEDFYFGVSK